ncbi:MAG: putative ATP-grasp superfamily ATP-dependent carboligase [Gammaproteobacteria bacterium]|jgi:predicted ATP-grasp superfamily ATP-dependent carboligase
MSNQALLIVGASARAACFSARRSSFSPYWIDQYGDHDLVENFPGVRVPTKHYPDGILDLLPKSSDVPFLFTGALENHLGILEKLESLRPLLGNSAAVCRAVRDPYRLRNCFESAGIKHPQIVSPDKVVEGLADYLIKPLRSAGGFGIRHYRAGEGENTRQEYIQEFIEGESRAGIFLGNGKSAFLLGVTRQLVGEAELHAAEFSYCGSIGPLPLDAYECEQWMDIGNVLSREFGLLGLFGVDAIRRAGDIYPVEVNPRYTASVEVLELALQLPVIALHVDACRGKMIAPVIPNIDTTMAKAYLFAGNDLMSPGDVNALYEGDDSFPLTADIPHADTCIPRGHPLMTVFAEGSSPEEVMQTLIDRANLLYSRFDVV